MTVSKAVYQNRKTNNLCTKCGKGAEQNKTLCSFHLQKASKNQKAMYNRRKSIGNCPLCGNELNNNRKICNQCLEKQVQKQRDDIWIPQKDRRKHELCLDCGLNESKSKLYCNSCSTKRITTQSVIRRQKIDNGLCGVCGKGLLANGKKRCTICIYKHKKWYSTSPNRDRNVEKNRLLKHQVIQHYGGKCNCCGETEETFLAIDHINGGGNAHRKKIKKLSSSAFYKWIINQNFPDELQILCHNCNMSKYLCGGICAHERKK